jgi:RNA polymerase sigma-70 factor, ECF subfamily
MFSWPCSIIIYGDLNFTPGMKEQTDKEILVAFSQGNPLAFEHIYHRFHTNIFLVAHRYIRSEEDAKDLRSKCFIKLWELHDKLNFESMGALFSWLRSTMTNSCIDYLRSISMRESKRPEIVSRYWQDNETAIFEASDKEAIILERLLKEIDQLPPKCKEVFKMRWLRDLKFREIAEELHTDVSTIKKRYSRAVILLKKNIPDRELAILFIFLFSDIYNN